MAKAAKIRLVSLLVLFGSWILLALVGADSSVLPYPWQLVSPFVDEVQSGELFFHLGYTLLRVFCAFVFAMTLGIVLGMAMGISQKFNDWLDPWLIFFLNLPALVLIVLCYIWIGLNETAAILAVTLNKIPNVTTVIREGARALNPSYQELAQIYDLKGKQYIRHILLPQMAPFIAGAARSGVAVIWKIVLVVEFLGRSNGIGFKIHLYFQLFDVPSVLVYSLSFIVVMLAIEFLLVQPWERHVNRWRQS